MKHTISLDGDWELDWESPDTALKGPIQARVPGDVNDDLARSGLLPEPLEADNQKLYTWTGKARFSYRRLILLPHTAARAEFIFDGLDLFAEIFLDGVPVGRADNAHIPWRYKLSGEGITWGDIKPEGHLLEVRIDSGLAWALQQDPSRYNATEHIERIFLRKAQYCFGWDWAPRLPSCGIWRSVRLELSDGPVLCHPAARCLSLIHPGDTAGQKMGGRATALADVQLLAAIETSVPAGVILAVTMTDPAGKSRALMAEQLVLDQGLNELTFTVDNLPVQAWWPAGQGEQPLYRIRFRLATPDGTSLDEQEFTWAFRTVDLDRSPLPQGGERFAVVVNGRRVFCKGANWVPADQFPGRVRPGKIRHLLEEARDANFTMLRIWGGASFESDFFYEECLRLGLMVWQDFMFACAEYPEDQPWFLAAVEAEIRQALVRLRNHQAIVLWCGNNENDWIHGFYSRGEEGLRAGDFFGRRLGHQYIPAIIGELDPSRPYWPSSPFGGDFPNADETGDKHSWEVSIHGMTRQQRTDFRTYREDTSRFVSEWGLLAPALPRTSLQCSGLDRLDPSNPALAAHDNLFNRGHTDRCIQDWYGPAAGDDPERRAWIGMAYQAAGYREGILASRRRMGECWGSLFWMYADCWPTQGWTILDWYLRRRPAWYWVRKAFAPLTVFSLNWGPRTEVYLVNDGPEDREVDLDIRAGTWDRSRQELRFRTIARAGECRQVQSIYDSKWWIRSAIYDPETGAALGEDLTTAFFPSELPIPEATFTWQAELQDNDTLVTIKASSFIHFLGIDHPDQARPDDNWFHVAPGLTRQVLVRNARPEELRLRALNTPDIPLS
jgi:beta-mannosidase